MLKNPFFKNKGPILISEISKKFNLKFSYKNKNEKVYDVKNLNESTSKDITFFHSAKYKNDANYTKAKYCITTDTLVKYLPNSCNPIVVNNVLLCLSQITKLFYPNSTTDDFCSSLQSIQKSVIKSKNLKIGRNVLVGKNISIGKNTSVGHNTIIENNVTIGLNCSIGSNVIIRNSIIKNNVHILDASIIGKKGFGFFPSKNQNFRYPHIGFVIINDNCEIGASSTIDRGSLSNTVIGKNTFFDNQVHVAHNVQIGENCIIAGQVGIAGSSIIGNNVMIGGQTGISGHLNIGNNVQIGGGSGVIKNIPDNTKVMGYPATEIKNFLKEMKSKND